MARGRLQSQKAPDDLVMRDASKERGFSAFLTHYASFFGVFRDGKSTAT
jgi:hypothetical protein